MPEMPPKPHAAVEARGGRLRLPDIRVPEVRLHSQGGRIERSIDLGRGRLARQRAKAADITASFSVKPAMQVERRIRLFHCGIILSDHQASPVLPVTERVVLPG